jgi:hypothetical protein
VVIFVEPLRWLFIVWGFASFVRGLRSGGAGQRVRLFRWCGRAGALMVLPDFMRRKRLLRKADRLARFIGEQARLHPGRPLHLVGYSTGCYLVTEALKRLEAPVAIGEVVLLHGAMSPGYRLEGLAGRVRRMHTFHSHLDMVISGVGPLLFGANDGRWGLGCGMIGFRQTPAFVVQQAWSRSAIALGYFGDHFSVTSANFVARRIAPILNG